MCQKWHVQTSLNCRHVLPIAVAQSSSDDDAVCYVVPFSCTTSCFHTVGQIHADTGSVCATWEELFVVTRQLVTGAKAAIVDCLVVQ